MASLASPSWLLLDEGVALGHGVARVHLHRLVLRPVSSPFHPDRVSARLHAVAEDRCDADLHAVYEDRAEGVGREREIALRFRGGGRRRLLALPLTARRRGHAHRLDGRRYQPARRRLALAGLRLDRKSTRLNSSHSQISYAVFCLKKKNIHTLISPRRTVEAD